MKDSEVAEERIKFLQEAAIMKQFAHQNVVFMFGVVTKRYPVRKFRNIFPLHLKHTGLLQKKLTSVINLRMKNV